MHANRNTKAVRRVSKGMFRANKSRNMFAIIAIIITTFMITTVFSLGISYKKNYDLMRKRNAGTIATISLPQPSREQYEQIRKLDYIDTAGVELLIENVEGTYKNNEFRASLMYFDWVDWSRNFMPAISDVKGNYPENTNEIMMSQGVLKQLGIDNPVINQTVNIPCGKCKGEYILTGWFKSYSQDKKNIILFSEMFCNHHNITLEENGMITISAKNPSDAYDLLVQDIELTDGQKFNSVFTVSDTETIWKAIFLMAMIVFFIMGSGFLLIYNVFYISVSRDINRYGMLKTLGTSPKQIRKIINNQALLLACIGIPVGLMMSAVCSLVIVPFVFKLFNNEAEFNDISFSPVIFIGAAVFSLVTVFISVKKPARIAGKISPIEALRYHSAASVKTKKLLKSKGSMKLYKMAWRNIFRYKKQTVLVVISLFLGSMTLLSVNGFLGSINDKAYAERYVKHDFAFINEVPFTADEFTQEFIDAVKSLDGIRNFKISFATFAQIDFNEDELRFILEDIFTEDGADLSDTEGYHTFLETMRGFADEGQYGTWLQSIDSELVEEYNKTHDKKIDLEAFESGNAVIALDEESYVGNSLTFIDKDNHKITAEIAGMFMVEDTDGYRMRTSFIGGMPELFFVHENFLKNHNFGEGIYSVIIDVEKGREDIIGSELAGLTQMIQGDSYKLYSKQELLENFNDIMRSMKIIGDCVAVFLLIIGILNFVNLMMTGIYSRRREFAVMQSVGVTKKQTIKLLRFEGFYYAVITTGMIATLGSLVLYVIAKFLPSIVDYAVFKYPVIPLLILLGCIYVFCIIVPFTVYNSASKDTITERLRDIEN